MGTKVLAKPIRGVSTMDIIRGIEEGEDKYEPFPIERARYLRSRCSDLKWEFPDRKYTVNEISEKGEARVWWKPVEKNQDND